MTKRLFETYGQVDAAAAGLNRFSGGRADTMGSEIATQRQAIDSKLQELMAYRQNLEDEAQAMMDKSKVLITTA